MDDQQLWDLGTVRLDALLAGLSCEAGAALSRLLACYRRTKIDHAAVIAEIDAAALCHGCRGQCCMNGKYRFNVLDCLVCRTEEIPMVPDFTRKPVCPYGTADGCTMEPGLRPADCIMFVCDEIDRKLSPRARLDLAKGERVLRECLHEASRLTGEQMGVPLLLWAGKSGTESKSKV